MQTKFENLLKICFNNYSKSNIITNFKKFNNLNQIYNKL